MRLLEHKASLYTGYILSLLLNPHIGMLIEDDWYQVLKVHPTATPAQITSAYRVGDVHYIDCDMQHAGADASLTVSADPVTDFASGQSCSG